MMIEAWPIRLRGHESTGAAIADRMGARVATVKMSEPGWVRAPPNRLERKTFHDLPRGATESRVQ